MSDAYGDPQDTGREGAPRPAEPPPGGTAPREPEPGPVRDPEREEPRRRARGADFEDDSTAGGLGVDDGDEPEDLDDQDEADASDLAENPDGDGRRTAGHRDDFFGAGPRLDVEGDADIGMLAGRDIHYHMHGKRPRRPTERPVPPDELAMLRAWYMPTAADPELRAKLTATGLVFLRVRAGDGGGTTALAVLDQVVRPAREPGRDGDAEHQATRLRRLGTAAPDVLLAAVGRGVGVIVDTLGTDWAARLNRPQVDDLRAGLRERGSFMVVLADADAALPVTDPVTHTPPAAEAVFERHLAFLSADRRGGAVPSPEEVEAARRTEVPTLVERIGEGPPEAQEWYAAVRAPGTPPRDGMIFARLWWNRPRGDTGEEGEEAPPFPRRDLTEQARNLLRSRRGLDGSPVRQAYVIAAAVLDGVPMSDITDRAARLAERFGAIESPGAGYRREVFGEPFRGWLEQLSAGSPAGSGPEPVWRRRRELARAVVEVAWGEYDVVRAPLREWLTDLCEQEDGVQRVRAVQALALIAARDYEQVRDKVLRQWSKQARNRPQECAAWLLEAMIRFGDDALRRKAERELRRLSRSRRKSERAVALRAYGTRITDERRLDEALDAVQMAVWQLKGRYGRLVAQTLRDLYWLGHRERVLKSLADQVRQHTHPPVRLNAARAVVRIARLPAGRGHDLLRFLHTLPHVGPLAELTLPDVADLWWYACDHPETRAGAWQALGRWHADCVAEPELMPTFDALLAAMARIDRPGRSADGRPLRTRIGLYRQFWNRRTLETDQ